MHVMEIYDDFTILLHVEEVRWNLDEKVMQANFRRFHVLDVEPPYLPPLCNEVTQGQHELVMHVVFEAII
jgi:hypothetical protein